MNQITKPTITPDEPQQARAALREAHAEAEAIKAKLASTETAADRAGQLIATLQRELARIGDAELEATRWRTDRLKAGESTAKLPVALFKKLEARANVEAELKDATSARAALDMEAQGLKADLAAALRTLCSAAHHALRMELAEGLIARLAEVEKERRELRTSLHSYLGNYFGLPGMKSLDLPPGVTGGGAEQAKLSWEGVSMLRYPEGVPGYSKVMVAAWQERFLALAADPDAPLTAPDYVKPLPNEF